MSLSVQIKHKFDDFDLDVAFSVQSGTCALFGRSGSGKSSIVNAIAGLYRPDLGRISIADRVLFDQRTRLNLPPHRRQIGTVFQDARLFPHLTVRQNLSYGLRFSPIPSPVKEQNKIIEMLGIGDLLNRYPVSLSGGEKQRVAIGRMLFSAPKMILADEPLAALDEARKREVIPYFERLRDEVDIPILYVSHAPNEVARLAKTIVALDHGRVVAQGPAAEILADPNIAPSGDEGAGVLIEAVVTVHHDDGLTELSASGIALFLPRVRANIGDIVRVRIAASDVLIALDRPTRMSALNIIDGVICAVHLGEGPGVLVSLKTRAGVVLARLTKRSMNALNLKEGSRCYGVVKTVAIARSDIGTTSNI